MGQRVICIIGRILDQEDGLGVYSANLLRCMFEQDKTTRYVIILRTPKHKAMFDEFPNVETQVIPSRSKLWWDQIVILFAARRACADIIFNPKFSIPVLSRRPCVFVLHGADWYVNPGNYTWWDNINIRIMQPIYCRKARKLLSIAQIAVDDMVKYANLDASKVTVSYGATASHFTPVNDKTRLKEFAKQYDLPERFILTVGRVLHTGHDRLDEYPGGNNESLVKGYQRYRASGGDLPLVVVGKDIEKYLRAHGFGDHELNGIHFTGFIPNQEISKVYNLAEFFVLATLYECFPLPLIEALSTGCPALVPSTGGCQELGAEAARYVDPLDIVAIGDAITELASSPELRERLRQAGLERVKRFSWDKTASRTLEVFDAIVPT